DVLVGDLGVELLDLGREVAAGDAARGRARVLELRLEALDLLLLALEGLLGLRRLELRLLRRALGGREGLLHRVELGRGGAAAAARGGDRAADRELRLELGLLELHRGYEVLLLLDDLGLLLERLLEGSGLRGATAAAAARGLGRLGLLLVLLGLLAL